MGFLTFDATDPAWATRVGSGVQPARSIAPPRCRDPIIVCSFGRSGTHLMIDMLRRQFPAFAAWKWPGERTSALYVSLEEALRLGDTRNRLARSARRAQRPIVKCHDWPRAATRLEASAPDVGAWLAARASTIVVLRDPATAISRLWSASGAHHGAGPAVDAELDAFVAHQARRWRDHVDAIEQMPRALTINFEALAADPAAAIDRVAAFVGEAPCLGAPLLVPPHRNRLHSGLARLAPRPLSSHILPKWSPWRPQPLPWSASRLDLLHRIAGDTMARAGYDGQAPGATGKSL